MVPPNLLVAWAGPQVPVLVFLKRGNAPNQTTRLHNGMCHAFVVYRFALVFASLTIFTASNAVSNAESPAPATPQICLVPLGKSDPQLLAVTKRGAHYLYGSDVKTLAKRALPRSAYYKPRHRYRADILLDYLDTLAPTQGCDIFVGVTSVDISTTKGKHKDWGVLGLGTLGGTSAVVSTFRMRRGATRRTLMRRLVNTVNHEIGHILSAPHGGNPGCLMNDANGTIKSIDKETGLLCPQSRALIEAHIQRPLPVHPVFDWKLVLTP